MELEGAIKRSLLDSKDVDKKTDLVLSVINALNNGCKNTKHSMRIVNNFLDFLEKDNSASNSSIILSSKFSSLEETTETKPIDTYKEKRISILLKKDTNCFRCYIPSIGMNEMFRSHEEINEFLRENFPRNVKFDQTFGRSLRSPKHVKLGQKFGGSLSSLKSSPKEKLDDIPKLDPRFHHGACFLCSGTGKFTLYRLALWLINKNKFSHSALCIYASYDDLLKKFGVGEKKEFWILHAYKTKLDGTKDGDGGL